MVLLSYREAITKKCSQLGNSYKAVIVIRTDATSHNYLDINVDPTL